MYDLPHFLCYSFIMNSVGTVVISVCVPPSFTPMVKGQSEMLLKDYLFLIQF